jgi:HK97 family phage portal protein
VALFWNRGHGGGQARASNLGALIDEATGGRHGITGARRRVGWSGALSIPAVWSAVRIRANVISSLPVQLYRDRDGLPERITGNAVPAVLAQPSAVFDMTDWLAASQLSLDLRGNAYGRILARHPVNNLPTQIELVHPDDVTVRLDRDGFVKYRFAGAGRELDALDVWHERQNTVPGEVVGLSPISAAARALGISVSAEEYGAGFYDEALTPSGLLSSDAPIDEDQAGIVKARVRATQQGREPLVLGGNWTYKPLSISPTDAAYLEVLARSDVDAARLFDVPGELIEANTSGSSITYANREQRVQDLLAFRLGPAIARRQNALTKLTVRGQYVRLNTAALLRGDLMTRYQSYERGLRNGFLSLAEVRALEDRPPLTQAELDQLHDAGLLGAATPSDLPNGTTPTTIPATSGAATP